MIITVDRKKEKVLTVDQMEAKIYTSQEPIWDPAPKVGSVRLEPCPARRDTKFWIFREYAIWVGTLKNLDIKLEFRLTKQLQAGWMWSLNPN